MPDYLPRVVDAELDDLLGALPAITLEGPKAVGKTATARRRANTVHQLDLPGARALAEADPTILLAGKPPILIDEWQYVPAVYDAVRRAVDDDASPNRYILAGSAVTAGLKQAPTHSGAGRIVRVRMRPLAISERGIARPTVSLGDLLTAKRSPVAGQTTITLADYAREIVGSGFPGIRSLNGPGDRASGTGRRALRAQLDGYLARIVDRDFMDQGHPVRRPETLRRWMTAYAAATATTTSFDKIRDAATSGEGQTPARPTVLAYRDVLERLWILDPVPAWLPSRSHLARLTQSPKHHLADPALAARLLGVDESALLSGDAADRSPKLTPPQGPLMGQLFESLVTLSVRIYAQAAEATVRHLRTREGRQEIDIIVERPDQRVLALEVKLGATVTDDDVRHLVWLREQLGREMLDAAVITTGTHAYRRRDGVAVIPAALLGP